MKFIRKIFSWTLISKTIKLFKSLYNYIQDYNIVSESLYSDAFLTILKRYLNKDFKIDWIGRVYAVINPNIDINGKFNFNNTIIELDDDRTNNEKYVQNWLYKQLQLISDVFKLENMYAYISMKIKHVGPKNHDNYLVIFDIATRIELAKLVKKFFKQLFFYILLSLIIILGYKFLF